MLTPVQRRFVLFVLERENVRLAKERGLPQPWTSDPLLRDYKFCNVNREHDAVTRWIGRNIRPILAKEKLATAVAQLYLCRIFNEPLVLNVLFPLKSYLKAKRDLLEMRANGHKILRGAYYCVPHGTSNRGRTPEDYFISKGIEVSGLKLGGSTTLEQVAVQLRTISGIGDFIANQVITDLRYQQPWGDHWKDWDTFVLAGPGTRRGLNRYLGAEDDRARKFPKLALSALECQALLLKIREDLQEHFPAYVNAHFEDPNNLSNCFCEFDKAERARGQLERGERVTIRKRHS